MIDDDEWPELKPDAKEEQLRYYWRLRTSFPDQTVSINEADLFRLVIDGLVQCNLLGILEPQQVVRFLALGFLITKEQRQSILMSRVTRRVLENTDYSARRRLNFVYKNVVGRSAPQHEPNFGPW